VHAPRLLHRLSRSSPFRCCGLATPPLLRSHPTQILELPPRLLWLGLALGDRAAFALGALMISSDGPCLRQLDLRANEISDAGAAQLAEAIELNGSVTHLLLSDNCVTDHGALALARALYRNHSLAVLWLDGAAPLHSLHSTLSTLSCARRAALLCPTPIAWQ